jgi:hypothetical protein
MAAKHQKDKVVLWISSRTGLSYEFAAAAVFSILFFACVALAVYFKPIR